MADIAANTDFRRKNFFFQRSALHYLHFVLMKACCITFSQSKVGVIAFFWLFYQLKPPFFSQEAH